MTTRNNASSPVVDSGDPDDLLKVKEVSRRLRVDDTTVRRWVNQGVLEAVILPRKKGSKRQSIRVRRQVIEDLINSGSSVQGLMLKEAQRTGVQS